MSDLNPAPSACGVGPVVVFVDSAFEPMIPKFMANRNKEVATMTDAIALTGNTLEEDIKKAQAAGFTAHLTKPLKKQTLLDAIRRYAIRSSDKECAA